jgi:hypothetical protein
LSRNNAGVDFSSPAGFAGLFLCKPQPAVIRRVDEFHAARPSMYRNREGSASASDAIQSIRLQEFLRRAAPIWPAGGERVTAAGALEVGEDLMAFDIADTLTVKRVVPRV